VQLRSECDRIMKAQGHEEPTGTAKITPAYNLPAKYQLVRGTRPGLRFRAAQIASCHPWPAHRSPRRRYRGR
jgi:hypothetical protein